MSSQYERGTCRNYIRIISRNQEVRLPEPEVLDFLGIDGIVRIPQDEYPETATPKSIWYHFNLPIHDNFPRTKVVLGRLIENGIYNQKTGYEQQPLISLKDIWIAEITGGWQQIPYEAIVWNCLGQVIGGMHDTISLQDTILKRYLRVLTDKTPQSILQQGVSLRILEFLGKISLAESDVNMMAAGIVSVEKISR